MIAQPARIIRILSLAITVLGLISACSSNFSTMADGVQPQEPVPRKASVGERAAAVATEQIGSPYRFGGSGPGGFDCSGLVQYSYSRVGMRVPRTTGQLWDATRTVSRHELRVGDLLFFNIGGKMSHVGLYLGSQRFVHAPSSGKSVSIASLDSPFYRTSFARAGRPY